MMIIRAALPHAAAWLSHLGVMEGRFGSTYEWQWIGAVARFRWEHERDQTVTRSLK